MTPPDVFTAASKSEALDRIGMDLIKAEPAGALYPLCSKRWTFHDGSMAICQPWGNLWMVAFLFR